MNYNCYSLLDVWNLQEQVKKAFCYQKLFWPFTVWINCSSDLKNFANFRPSASNFKSFSQSLEQYFLTVGQNNFVNKIPYQIILRLLFFSSSSYFRIMNVSAFRKENEKWHDIHWCWQKVQGVRWSIRLCMHLIASLPDLLTLFKNEVELTCSVFCHSFSISNNVFDVAFWQPLRWDGMAWMAMRTKIYGNGNNRIQSDAFRKMSTINSIYGILFQKLFWPSARKKCSSDREKVF